MTFSARDESGFTIIELLVTITLFAIVSVGFYQVLFSATRGSDTAQRVARISQEARQGFNRMIRDTREGRLDSASSTSYNVQIDFDGDGDTSVATENPNGSGDFENLTFAYVAGDKTLTLNKEVLIEGVSPIGSEPIFSYSSNFLEYDWNANGVTEWEELDTAADHGISGVGNDNGIMDAGELNYISSINYAFTVTAGDSSSEFYGQAQLRNRR